MSKQIILTPNLWIVYPWDVVKQLWNKYNIGQHWIHLIWPGRFEIGITQSQNSIIVSVIIVTGWKWKLFTESY